MLDRYHRYCIPILVVHHNSGARKMIDDGHFKVLNDTNPNSFSQFHFISCIFDKLTLKPVTFNIFYNFNRWKLTIKN